LFGRPGRSARGIGRRGVAEGVNERIARAERFETPFCKEWQGPDGVGQWRGAALV